MMRKVTILEKCYGPYTRQGLKGLSDRLRRLCHDLEVMIHSVECGTGGWIRVVLSGGDEEFFVSYLEKEFGLSPGTIERVVIGKSLRGKIVGSGSVGYGLYVDLGINHPDRIDALVPLHVLRAQLAGNRKASLREIIHAFCLFDNVTLDIVPTKVDRDRLVIEACISDSQLSILREWKEMNLERIIVIGAPRSQVKRSVSRSGHRRDILRVDVLGLLESSVVCKLGTHAKGLIPKLGHSLHGVSMHIFLPRRARNLHK